jgi:hypothetical protein
LNGFGKALVIAIPIGIGTFAIRSLEIEELFNITAPIVDNKGCCPSS